MLPSLKNRQKIKNDGAPQFLEILEPHKNSNNIAVGKEQLQKLEESERNGIDQQNASDNIQPSEMSLCNSEDLQKVNAENLQKVNKNFFQEAQHSIDQAIQEQQSLQEPLESKNPITQNNRVRVSLSSSDSLSAQELDDKAIAANSLDDHSASNSHGMIGDSKKSSSTQSGLNVALDNRVASPNGFQQEKGANSLTTSPQETELLSEKNEQGKQKSFGISNDNSSEEEQIKEDESISSDTEVSSKEQQSKDEKTLELQEDAYYNDQFSSLKDSNNNVEKKETEVEEIISPILNSGSAQHSPRILSSRSNSEGSTSDVEESDEEVLSATIEEKNKDQNLGIQPHQKPNLVRASEIPKRETVEELLALRRQRSNSVPNSPSKDKLGKNGNNPLFESFRASKGGALNELAPYEEKESQIGNGPSLVERKRKNWRFNANGKVVQSKDDSTLNSKGTGPTQSDFAFTPQKEKSTGDREDS